MDVSSQRLTPVQHRHLPARGLLSLFRLLRAFLLTVIKREPWTWSPTLTTAATRADVSAAKTSGARVIARSVVVKATHASVTSARKLGARLVNVAGAHRKCTTACTKRRKQTALIRCDELSATTLACSHCHNDCSLMLRLRRLLSIVLSLLSPRTTASSVFSFVCRWLLGARTATSAFSSIDVDACENYAHDVVVHHY